MEVHGGKRGGEEKRPLVQLPFFSQQQPTEFFFFLKGHGVDFLLENLILGVTRRKEKPLFFSFPVLLLLLIQSRSLLIRQHQKLVEVVFFFLQQQQQHRHSLLGNLWAPRFDDLLVLKKIPE